MPNVCDNNLYEDQTCVLLYYCELIVLMSVQDDGDVCESTSKDELPQPRGCLANNIPSHAIQQANQEFQQDDRHSQHASNA